MTPIRRPREYWRPAGLLRRLTHTLWLSTASVPHREQQFGRVTHPFHPLFGRRFELLTVRQTWGEDRVFFYEEHDVLKALPARWTDAGTPDPFVVLAAGRAYFRPEDLVALSQLLERLEHSAQTKGERDEC